MRFGGSPEEGHSSNDHVHFEIIVNGVVVPANYPGIQFSKGLIKAKPFQNLSQSPVSLQQSFDAQPEPYNIVTVRPNEGLFLNLKAFDWEESVKLRALDADGNVMQGVLPAGNASGEAIYSTGL